MSITLTITGNESALQSEFNPPLILNGDYECGLLYFSTFHSIPNIHENNNVFTYDENKEVKIPYGVYDLLDIDQYLKTNARDCDIQIRPNNNTLKCSLFCTKYINFDVENSVGSLLGFPPKILEPNKWHDSIHPINILPVSVIRIECDLVQSSFTNGVPTHIIHEFVLNIPPGNQLLEIPKNIIYFPVKKKEITSISIKIVDLQGNLINFRKEHIQLSLHLQKSK